MATAPTCRRRWRCEYLRGLCQEDRLAQGSFTVLGKTVSLADVTLPVCAIACETDHIAAWRSSFNGIAQMGSKDKTFILSESGHIAGIVNPPGKKKYGHYTNDVPLERPGCLEGGGRATSGILVAALGAPGWPSGRVQRFRRACPVIRPIRFLQLRPAPMWWHSQASDFAAA